MEQLICDTPEELARTASAMVVGAVNAKPDLVLCLPTGRTPRGVYRQLVAAHRSGLVSFGEATIISIDEYVGLAADDHGSFAHEVQQNLLKHIDLAPDRSHIPDGNAVDPGAEARRYDQLINCLGGIDLIVLGVGVNGHVGFNEPGSSPDSRTRVVDLTPETLAANAGEFPDGLEPPRRGITIGIANILAAGKIIVLASGERKAEPIRQLFGKGSSADWPIAALRAHRDVTVLVDRAAAGLHAA